MDTSIIYRTSDSLYVTQGDKAVKLFIVNWQDKKIDLGVAEVSPVVGSIPKDASEDVAEGIHHRVEGYQELYTPEIRVGNSLVRDWPEKKPYAGVSSPIQEIIVVLGDLETAIERAKECY